MMFTRRFILSGYVDMPTTGPCYVTPIFNGSGNGGWLQNFGDDDLVRTFLRLDNDDDNRIISVHDCERYRIKGQPALFGFKESRQNVVFGTREELEFPLKGLFYKLGGRPHTQRAIARFLKSEALLKIVDEIHDSTRTRQHQMHAWYISYAWGDDRTPEGRARAEIVDKLCAAAEADGHRILRDRDQLSLGDSISAFMKRIGSGDRVFVILSEKYLRSPFCMFELSEVWRTSKQQGDAFLKRVKIFALPDATISKPTDWVRWAAYWKLEFDELDALARQHGAALLGEHGHRRLRQMQTFYTQVADILGTLADIVQPRTFDELKLYGFGDP